VIGLIQSVFQTLGGRPSLENMDKDDGVMLWVGVMNSGFCWVGSELKVFAGG
jgi:hypothetical protein